MTIPSVCLVLRVCDGRADPAELQGAHCHPGPGLPPGAERPRHGGNRPDRLGEDALGEGPAVWSARASKNCPSKKKKKKKNVAHSPFALITERVCCAVVFDDLHAASQHLFPSRVAVIFGRDFVLIIGESNHSFSLFQHIPITFNGVKVRTRVANSCVKMTPLLPDTRVSSRSTLSQLEPDESWHCRPGICPSHQRRKNPLRG